MGSWAIIDSKRLFAAADALLDAVRSQTSVLTLLAETDESRPAPVLVFTPRELEEAAAMLKRMGYLDGDGVDE